MKLSTRMITLGITAVALAGALGAQQRGNGRAAAPRAQAPRMGAQSFARSQPRMGGQSYARPQAPRMGGQSYARPQAPRMGGQSFVRSQPPSGQFDNRQRQDVRVQQYSRAGVDVRGGGGPNQPRNVYRTPTPYRVPVADHGRPLITRGFASDRGYGRPNAYAGQRFGGGRDLRGGGDFRGSRDFRDGREFRDGRWYYGGRAFPFGWESSVVFGGFFPVAYAGYCADVPLDYDYMLPPMSPYDDPCLFGDRVIVFDRFSRHIVFVATL